MKPMLQERGYRTRIHFFFPSLVLLLLMQNDAAWASNDEFRTACIKLGETVAVVVTFMDIAASENSSHTLKSLKSLSGKTSDPHHNVYGLTQAEPTFSYEIKPRWGISPVGQTCMVPDVSVKMGFSAMRVYLARELQDSCRKNIVREHELEHVSAWKSHFRIGAKLLEDPLRRAFSQPRYYASRTQAQADLQPWAEGVLKPFQQRLMQGVASAHRAIDSPISYNHVKKRLRACPPSADGIL
ncbi:hypothetical protein SAMN05216420_11045 [Nitrosospira sp. Nl5]|uniref:hypothetical protein n=1 Tax=Nitrosospira sp. Nl5 TaxID=200120 RepID=UPI000880CB9F|nr:hypothetical protein [Nitrosospira sp. Nl5]SCY61481.1 hypothetical protein SAMN05216420_11045 [Nitrosospira sp. Nl5]